ncbi:MAG: hypothetical protein SNH55_03720 [Rikenellaceae bacterium]
MKEKYIAPQIEVIGIEIEDAVLVASNGTGTQTDSTNSIKIEEASNGFTL